MLWFEVFSLPFPVSVTVHRCRLHQCNSHSQRALQTSIRLVLYIRKKQDKDKKKRKSYKISPVLLLFNRAAIGKRNQALSPEICCLPCHEQSNNKAEKTEDRAENLNDKNLDEPARKG